MAEIPVYMRQASQRLATGYTQQLRAPAGAFGAGVAKGIQDLGAGIAAVAQKEQDRQDAAARNDLRDRLGKIGLDYRKQLSKSRGQQALEFGAEAPESFEKDTKALEEEIKNERVRAWFRAERTSAGLSFQGAVDHHTVRASDQLAKDAYTGATATATQLAAVAAQSEDDQGVLEAHQQAYEAWQSYMEHEGMSGTEEGKTAHLEVMTQLHSAVLTEKLARGEHAGAQAYLKEWDPEIAADVAGKFRDKTKAVSSAVRAGQIAAGLADKHRKGALDWDWVGARAEADANAELQSNPEMADQVESALAQEARRNRGARLEWDGDRIAQIELDLASKQVRRVRQHPMFSELSIRGQTTALRLEASMRKRPDRTGQSKLDKLILTEFKGLPLEERLAADINEYGAKATSQGRADLRAYKRGLLERQGQTAGEARRTAQGYADRMGLIGSSRSSKGKNRIRFLGYMQDRWDEYEADPPHAGKPTQEEVEQWATSAFEKVEIPGGGLFGLFDAAAPRYLLEHEEPLAPPAEPAPAPAPAAEPAPPDQPPAVTSTADLPMATFIALRNEFRAKYGRDPAGADDQLMLMVYTRNPDRYAGK